MFANDIIAVNRINTVKKKKNYTVYSIDYNCNQHIYYTQPTHHDQKANKKMNGQQYNKMIKNIYRGRTRERAKF